MSSNKKTLIDGDFQVGSNHFKVDTTNNYVGFNNATPQNKIDVQIGARTGTHSTDKPLYVTGVTGTSGAEFVSDDGTTGIGIGSSNIFTTGTNQNLTIAPDGTGALGIKTATPNPAGETFDLWVQGDTRVTGNVTAGTFFGDGSGLTNIISSQWDSSSEDIYFLNNSGSGSGRVAIGTTTPVSVLTLEGDSGGAPPTTGQEGTSNALVRVRDDNNVTLDIGTSSGTVWLQSSDATNMSTNYPVSVNPNGGNVGVGTITPNVPLEVSKSAGGEILRLTTSTGTLYAGADANPPWFGTSSNDHLRLMTNGTEKIRIETGGNVGVGTTTPGFDLDVNGDINFTGNLYEDGALFVSTPWTIETSPDALSYTTGNVGIGTTTAGYTLDVGGDINFSGNLYEDGALFVSSPWTMETSPEALSYTTGNVGIGTTTAGYTLDVGGDINFTGNLYEDGALFESSPWNVETSPDALNYTSGNVGIGSTNPSSTLEVTGNTHVSSNLSVGGVLKINTITAAAQHSLQAVTNVGNITSNTVQFSNVTTGLVTTGNVEVGKELTVSGNAEVGTANLFVDTVNSRVGIGTTVPAYSFDVQTTSDASDKTMTRLYSAANATGVSSTGLILEKGAGYGGVIKGFISQGIGSGLSLHTLNGGTEAQAMTIMNSGNVGVGTTSPGAPLDVFAPVASGTRRTALRLTTPESAAGTGCNLDFFQATANVGRIASVYEAAGQIGMSFSTWNSALGERMRITSTGHVGIGTTNPGNPLVIYGPDQVNTFGAQCVISSDSTTGVINSGGTLLFQGHDGVNTRGWATVSGLKENGTSGNYASYLRFHTRSSGASVLTERMRITSVGNVGIGTTSPQYRLDVGNGGGDVMLRVMNQTASSGKLIFGRSGNTEIRSHAIESYNSSGSQNNYMKFLVHDGTGTSPYETRTEVMTLLGNGNVGIGTTEPSNRLEVSVSSSGDSIGVNHSIMSVLQSSEPTYGKYGLFHGVQQSSGTSWLQTGRTGTMTAGGVSNSDTFNLLLNPSGGNVGIGKTSPGTKLDVNGVIKSAVPSWGVHQLGTASGLLRMTGTHTTAQNCTVALSTGSPARTRVTATVAGRYFVSFMAFSEYNVPAGQSVQITLLKNGNTHARNYAVQPITNYSANGGIAVLVDLAVNDYLEIDTNNTLHHNANGYFSGFLVG